MIVSVFMWFQYYIFYYICCVNILRYNAATLYTMFYLYSRMDMTHLGQLKTELHPDVCLHPDTTSGNLITIKCDQQELHAHFFYLDKANRFMFRDSCIRVIHNGTSVLLGVSGCPSDPMVRWSAAQDGSIRMVSGSTTMCLCLNGSDVTISKCNSARSQLWTFTYKFNFSNDWDISEVVARRLKQPEHAVYFGWLRNLASHHCLAVYDNLQHDMKPCNEQADYEQIIHMDKDDTIRYRNLCLARNSGMDKAVTSLKIIRCSAVSNSSFIHWSYDENTRRLSSNGSGYCLESKSKVAPTETTTAYLALCDTKKLGQMWRFRTNI